MEERTKIHVGLDVHKDSIAVSVADPGREKARLFGKVAHDVPQLLKVLAKIGDVEELHIVYEAGPTGFGLQRALANKGYACQVFTPSKTPRQPGQDRCPRQPGACGVLACRQAERGVDPRPGGRSDPRSLTGG